MLRNVIVSCAFLSFVACASPSTPLNTPPSAPLNIRTNPNEVCAAEVQPPVVSPEENPDLQPVVVLERVAPRSAENLLGKSRATVEAVIGEDGVARNICVVAGDPEWGRAVAAALRQWTFKPATLDGKPVPVKFTLTVDFHPD